MKARLTRSTSELITREAPVEFGTAEARALLASALGVDPWRLELHGWAWQSIHLGWELRVTWTIAPPT